MALLIAGVAGSHRRTRVKRKLCFRPALESCPQGRPRASLASLRNCGRAVPPLVVLRICVEVPSQLKTSRNSIKKKRGKPVSVKMSLLSTLSLLRPTVMSKPLPQRALLERQVCCSPPQPVGETQACLSETSVFAGWGSKPPLVWVAFTEAGRSLAGALEASLGTH